MVRTSLRTCVFYMFEWSPHHFTLFCACLSGHHAMSLYFVHVWLVTMPCHYFVHIWVITTPCHCILCTFEWSPHHVTILCTLSAHHSMSLFCAHFECSPCHVTILCTFWVLTMPCHYFVHVWVVTTPCHCCLLIYSSHCLSLHILHCSLYTCFLPCLKISFLPHKGSL
jgi:hypothetical protein